MNDELLREGRSMIINGILAYGEAFELVHDGGFEALAAELEEELEAVEAVIPVLKSLYEMEQKLTGANETFAEWAIRVAKEKGGKGLFEE